MSGTVRGLLAVAALCVSVVYGADTRTTPVQAAGAGDARAEYATKGDLGFQWHGDVRIRNTAMTTSAVGKDNTGYALQARLRLGASGQLGEKTSYGFRLETAAGLANTANGVLGAGDFLGGGGGLGVGLAYLGFQLHPKVDLTVGKMNDGFWNGELLWDDDVQPEGVQVGWQIYEGSEGQIFRNIHNEAALYYLGAKGLGVAGMPVVIADQVTADVGPTHLGIGLVYYNENLSKSPSAGTNFANDANAIVHGKAEYGFNAWGVPLKVGGEAVYNTSTGSNAGAFGWELRLDAPKAGPGAARLLLRDVGVSASYAPWADSDLGGSPAIPVGLHTGIEAGYSVGIAKPVTLDLAWFHWDLNNGVGVGSNDTFQIDLRAGF